MKQLMENDYETRVLISRQLQRVNSACIVKGLHGEEKGIFKFFFLVKKD